MMQIAEPWVPSPRSVSASITMCSLLEVDPHHDAPARGPADLGEPGGGEDAAAANVELSLGDLLPWPRDHRVALEGTGAALAGEVDGRGMDTFLVSAFSLYSAGGADFPQHVADDPEGPAAWRPCLGTGFFLRSGRHGEFLRGSGRREEPLEIQGRHRARSGRGDRLAVDGIGDIAGSEHARDARRRGIAVETALGHEIAALHVELALEKAGVRRVSDRDENAIHHELMRLAGRRVPNAKPGHAALVAKHLFDLVLEEDRDVPLGDLAEQAVPEDLLGLERASAMDERHVRREVRQVERLLDGR